MDYKKYTYIPSEYKSISHLYVVLFIFDVEFLYEIVMLYRLCLRLLIGFLWIVVM